MMDLELKKAWENEEEDFPMYRGKIVRVIHDENGAKAAVHFIGFGKEFEASLDRIQF